MVTLIQCYFSTKLEVTGAFLFRENRRHGTDGRTDRRTGPRGSIVILDSGSILDCLHGSWTCTGLSGHGRLFVLVSSYYVFLFLVTHVC